MQLTAAEVSDLIKKKIESFDVGVEARTEGTIVSLTDGIARIHGLSDVMQGEMIEFPGNTFGLALNLERDSVGSVIMGDYGHIAEGDTVKCTGRILEVPVGRGLLGRVVNSLGQPIDGKGPIESEGASPIEKVAPGVITRQSVGQPVADGAEVHRRDGADRARPARADHRRPADRQDRGRHRHHHQPEGWGPHLHLRRHRPEELLHRQRGAQARGARGDGAHHRGRRRRLGVRGAAVHRAVLGMHDGRVLPAAGARTPSSSTTISPSRRGRIARSRCCCGVRRVARRIPATCSTCTRACWSVRRG